ncbi:CBS domain-containing protein [Pistricoccus aurantiacus]|uniref:CBS domain-containing protein n=1 Tax=Pistricoccus aurantiacus TaxID=1883414 RepID=UPI00362EBF56
MRAADVMTTKVISVALESEVREIASLLAEHGISAVPVVDSEQRVLGIVSEGDLIRRIENDEDSHKSWWLKLFSGTSVVDYVKAHGRCAGEVMTPDPLTVSEDEPLHRIAGLLEKYRIKRVPVVRDGRLVGIVSRSNLLRGFATVEPEIEASIDDRNIRKAIYKELKALSGLWGEHLTVIVSDGCVQLWGLVETKEQRWAVQVAAENTPGVKQVINHLGLRPRGIGGY